MAHQLEVFPVKPEDWDSIFRVYMIEEKNQIS